MNKVDRSNKPAKGLIDRGIVNFECTNCNKFLLVLQLTAVSEKPQGAAVLTRVVVKCCECDHFSRVEQIRGEFYPGAPSDQMAFDILCDDPYAPEADVLFKAWAK